MNNVILMGRLTRDPELRYLQGGSGGAVARFTIAVDKALSREKRQEMESRNQATADFINIVVWGKLAENVARFTQKGKRVLVTGRIQTGFYDDKDGKRVYTTDVVASGVEFIDWKDGNSSFSPSGYGNSQGSNSSDSHADFNNKGDFNDEFEFGADFDPTNDDGRIPF
ncbi:MAG: single-stranded DNA-binding protein [Tissierellia bacterium]|nr:single-stranded DNA-binding protein [Tissierellia bacterium]